MQSYALVGGRLIAGGVSVRALDVSGNPTFRPDLPQVSLSVGCTSFATGNSRRIVLRGIPDVMMVNGEYQPQDFQHAFVTDYLDYLSGGLFSFPGRVLAATSWDIDGIADGKVTVIQNPPPPVGTRLRFLRCKDIFDIPVEGVYTVSAVTGQEVTLRNLNATIVAEHSGRLREDSVALYTINSATPGRATVRKIGGPFEKYRGRRSKRRVRR